MLAYLAKLQLKYKMSFIRIHKHNEVGLILIPGSLLPYTILPIYILTWFGLVCLLVPTQKCVVHKEYMIVLYIILNK